MLIENLAAPSTNLEREARREADEPGPGEPYFEAVEHLMRTLRRTWSGSLTSSQKPCDSDPCFLETVLESLAWGNPVGNLLAWEPCKVA